MKVPDGFAIFLRTNKTTTNSYYKDEIVTVFTCNWAKDFDINGLDFSEFYGIKRSFEINENMLYVLACTSNSNGKWNMAIYDNKHGNVIEQKEGQICLGKNIVTIARSTQNLAKGEYVINFSIYSNSYAPISKREKFEIY